MLSLTRRRLVVVFALFCCAVFALAGVGRWAPSLTSAANNGLNGPATPTSGAIGYTEAWCGAPPATWQQPEPLVLPPHESPVTVPISITNFTFSPSDVTISVGDTVMWTNNDPFTHTTTSDNAVWNSGNLAGGQTFSFTFTSAGDFPYHCNIFPSKKTPTFPRLPHV